MAQTLSSLLVDIRVDTAQLQKGLDQANAKIAGLSKQLSNVGKSLSLAAVGTVAKDAAVALGAFVLKGAQATDAMGKQAQAAGTTVEAFSRIDYAAGLSGVSTEELGKSLSKLNKNLAEAGAGAKPQAALFKALGINVKDSAGNVRSLEPVLAQLAQRFAGFKDGASKSTLAMELFGKSGAKMLPLLNSGKEGLAALGAEADRLGITITSKMAASAERFNDNLEKLERVSNAVGMQVAGNITPALTKFTDELLTTRDGAEALRGAVEFLTTAIKLLVSAGVVVGAVFEALGTAIAHVASGIVNIATGNFSGALEDLQGTITDTVGTAEKAAGRLGTIWGKGTGADEALNKQDKRFQKSADSVLANVERMRKAMAKDLDFELNLKITRTQGDAADRRAAHNALNDPAAAWANLTAGFKNFDEALDAATEASIKRDTWMNEAAHRRANGDIDGAQEATRFAEKMGRASDKALKAADAFDQLDQTLAQMNKTIGGKIGTGIFNLATGGSGNPDQLAAAGALGNKAAGKLGRAGEVAGTALEGFEVGGIWGAIIGAIVELISGSQSFTDLIATWDDQLKTLGDAFGHVLDTFGEAAAAMSPLTDMIGGLISSIVGLLNTMHGVGKIGDALAPLVNLIGNVLEPITSIIDAIGQMIEGIGAFDIVIKVISVILNTVALTILGTILGIQKFWEGVTDALHNFLVNLPGEFFDGAALEVSKWNVDADRGAKATEAQINKIIGHNGEGLWNPHSNEDAPAITTIGGPAADATTSIKDLGESAGKTATAMARLTEQFTNLPQGFRVRLAQYNAMDPARMQLPDKAGLGGDIHIHVDGLFTTIDDLANRLAEAQKKKNFRRSGFPFP